MSIKGFTFRGVHSSAFFIVNRINRSVAPEVEGHSVQIPERRGSYDFGSRVGARKWEVEVTFLEASTDDLWTKMRDVTGWLIDTKHDDLHELEFDSEPNRKYKARFTGGSQLDTLASMGTAVLTFVAPDPHAYSDPINLSIPSSGQTIMNGGGVETYPVMRFTLKKPTTSLDVARRNDHGELDYIFLGKTTNVNQVAVYKDERVFWDQMTEPTEWINGGTVDGGDTSGSWKVNSGGYYFLPESYYDESYSPDYSNPNNPERPHEKWHGPSEVKALSNPVQDFKVDTRFEFAASGAEEIGRLEVYLLDINGAVLGKTSMVDLGTGRIQNLGEARAGTHGGGQHLVGTGQATAGHWKDFDGGIWIRRVGNRWDAQFYGLDADGNHEWSHTTMMHYGYFYDDAGDFMNELAQIQIHAGAYADHKPVSRVQLHDIKVYNLTDYDRETEVPFIGQTEDVIEIDCAKSSVRVDGAKELGLLNPTSEFFSLARGGNDIIYDDSIADLEIEYKERWL